jgi:hypothetical protein
MVGVLCGKQGPCSEIACRGLTRPLFASTYEMFHVVSYRAAYYGAIDSHGCPGSFGEERS